MGDTANATWRFEWTGMVFTDTMLTLPTGCVNKEERGLGVCVLGGFLLQRRAATETQMRCRLSHLCSHRKQSPTPAPAHPLPRLRKGQETSASDNGALTVFSKHHGGRGPALCPAEMAHKLLHFRGTRTADPLSSLDMVAQY